MLQLRFKKSALKILHKAPAHAGERLMTALETIATDPSRYKGDFKPMKGTVYHRLRVGGWRVICEIRRNDGILMVLKAEPRGDIYK